MSDQTEISSPPHPLWRTHRPPLYPIPIPIGVVCRSAVKGEGGWAGTGAEFVFLFSILSFIILCSYCILWKCWWFWQCLDSYCILWKCWWFWQCSDSYCILRKCWWFWQCSVSVPMRTIAQYYCSYVLTYKWRENKGRGGLTIWNLQFRASQFSHIKNKLRLLHLGFDLILIWFYQPFFPSFNF